ncbi:MAG: hypothetical protein LRY41_00595 [Candidatus Pacebacteria bacterium]|nr:hypothetical protein [Candidatus Paceibacterota bacterium]MCD8507852.1 hypothetical protein [Candidatus Paceibacterota bacterium]MCD8527826.1 hypothetical protein [Candidatus Paceibacterota bacterium]MCD8563531.1 hypothetical protein [Candidatus Paceibacterota bacterium]
MKKTFVGLCIFIIFLIAVLVISRPRPYNETPSHTIPEQGTDAPYTLAPGTEGADEASSSDESVIESSDLSEEGGGQDGETSPSSDIEMPTDA